jgi:hypothetical protein
MRTKVRHQWLVLLFFVSLAGCSSGHPRSLTTTSGSHSELIRQDDYGETWPFGPNEGLLRCRATGGKRSVTIKVNGVEYAVNETAKRHGAADLRSILTTDHSGFLLDYSQVLEDGLRLCG